MLVHYVEFFYPGIIVSETSTQKIENRQKIINAPRNAYAYRFFDREEIMQDGELLQGKPKDYSGTFYLGGKIKTKEQILQEEPTSILASNMRCNKIERVVITKWGQAMTLHPEDKAL